MKNVVIISSTPRTNGNSFVLAKEFARGASDASNNVEIINLKDYDLNYCKGCYACFKIGKCVQNDGMNDIADKLVKADVIVFSTPVYFYSVSGQLKVFIDRLVPVYEKIKADIYLIATQADSSKEMMEKTFEAIRGCSKDCFENCIEKGAIYGVGLSEKGEAEKNLKYMEEAYNLGYNC